MLRKPMTLNASANGATNLEALHLQIISPSGMSHLPSAVRGRTATDDGAAAWSHRGTLVGELAARTSLRGDVEVAHPATVPCYSRVPHRPRAT